MNLAVIGRFLSALIVTSGMVMQTGLLPFGAMVISKNWNVRLVVKPSGLMNMSREITRYLKKIPKLSGKEKLRHMIKRSKKEKPRAKK